MYLRGNQEQIARTPPVMQTRSGLAQSTRHSRESGDTATILVATDLTLRSQRAVRRAGLLARQLKADVALLHVIENAPETLSLPERREARNAIADMVRSLPEFRSIRYRSIVLGGDPMTVIASCAATHDADLVILGAGQRRLFGRTGRIARAAARAFTQPVLVVRKDARAPYREAVLAVDLEDDSFGPLRVAQQLHARGGVSITALHAYSAMARNKMFIAGIARENIARYVDELRISAGRDLSNYLRRGGPDAHTWQHRVEEGTPMQVISRSVHVLAPDLVIIGARRDAGIRGLLGRSPTEDVVNSVNVDTMIVPGNLQSGRWRQEHTGRTAYRARGGDLPVPRLLSFDDIQ